ncbi:MAG: hypothetical protein V3T08_09275 [Gemmatimonadota bacterium]
MNLVQLKNLSDDTPVVVTAGWLREQLEATPELVTTHGASKMFSFAATSWAKWCRAGEVRGAFRDANGRWRLPVAACREHVGRLKNQDTRSRRRKRVPWQTAPPASVGTEGVPRPELALVQDGSSTVGPEARDDAKPTGSGVA